MGRHPAIFRCPSEIGDPVIPADPSPNAPFTPTYGPGGNYVGAKSNYDFSAIALAELGCNSWKYTPSPSGDGAQHMFGQNSNCPIARVTDGMSNSFMLAETLFTVKTGECSAWGYRSWQMAGVDPAQGINNFYWGFGTLTQWGQPGSMHPGGCFFAMGDGSVHWVSQSVNDSVLYDLSTINDATAPEVE